MPHPISTTNTQQEVVPLPDPTVLTTAQLLRQIQGLNALMEAKFSGYRESNDSRFDGITREFSLIESRRVEQKIDTKVAVDAALSAAEKAVREQTVASEKSIIKSETSSAEQSKQQNATFTASIKGVQDTVVDLKERFSKLENTRLGATEAKDTQRLDMGMILSFGFFLIALVSIAITIVTMVMN